MTTRVDELLALAALLVATPGPNHELDWRIHRVLGRPLQVWTDGGWCEPGYWRELPVPHYTATFSSTLTMVPEGGRWFKCTTEIDAGVRFVVVGPADDEGRWHAWGECPTDETEFGDIRALAVAALFAHASQENQNA